MQHASVGFKNARSVRQSLYCTVLYCTVLYCRWVSEYRLEKASSDQFVIKHDRRSSWDCQFYHWSLFTVELL